MMRRLALLLLIGVLTAQPAAAGTLSPGLQDQMQGLQDDDVLRVLVVLKDRPDVVTLDKSLVKAGTTLPDRHRNVVSTLQHAATASQADLLADLGAAKAAGGVVGYVPHWIVNSVVVTASVARIRALADRPDVDTIEADLVVEPIEPVEVKPAAMAPDKGDKGFVTPGLAAINVPRVWHELGIDGTGSIVAGLDSGVDRTHPMLASRWRGNVAPAAECWNDLAHMGSAAPVDYHGHGTHTMGTMTGATSADTVGVAPGAQWIATNAIYASGDLDNPVIAAFEWLADPDGDPATSDDVPDVVNNSWGVTAASAGYLACDTRWYDVIDNCEAAGVVVIWAAGNEGPAPSTLRSPPNRASTPTNCFSVGSTRTMYPYLISSFSSRGPSQCGGPYAIKPEVTAPGQDILSAYPGGQYAYMSGTSMAAPHIAGVVALLRQARPDLDPVTIKEILMASTVDLGAAGEDNDYGHGIVDAYAAVLIALNEMGTVSGTVTDSGDGQPLADVLIRDLTGQTTRTTGSDGTYSFTLRTGERQLSAEKFGYVTASLDLDLPGNATLVRDIVLVRAPWSRIAGTVHGPDGQPLAGAAVQVQDTPVAAAVSDSAGRYLVDLPSGEGFSYVVVASSPGLAYDLRYVGLEGDADVDFALSLPRGDGYESGDFSAFPYTDGGAAAWTVGGEEAHEGLLSARSGVIGNGQQTSLSVNYYANGDGEFSFWHKTDSETGYDVLTVSIDGTVRGTWSGSGGGWTQFTSDLATGLHTITWTYRKDVSASVGRDAAWIDEISFPGTGVQPFAQCLPGSTAVAATIQAGTVVAVPFTLTNAGGAPLDWSAVLALPGPDADAPTWATLSPAAGVLYPFNDTGLELSFDGSAAPAGQHEAVLHLTSNDPAAPVIEVPVTLTVVAVSGVPADTPQQPAIEGIIPNPFNPVTSVQFSLPQDARVSLRLYDVAGRLVRTLVDTDLPAGVHRRNWDGRDDAGRNMASGVYFARLQAAGRTEIRSMTLVR